MKTLANWASKNPEFSSVLPATTSTSSGLTVADSLLVEPAYTAVYGYRPDAESLDAQLEAMHYFHRLPAYGAERQTLVIGAVTSENSVSRYHHLRRQRQDAA